MKKIQLSIIALISCSSYVMAGGDIAPVTYYEAEDVKAAEIVEVVVPPVVVEAPAVVKAPVIVQAPVPIAPLASVLGAYIGLGLVAAQYDTNCNCTRTSKSGVDKTAGLMTRIGYDFNKYVGLEGRGIRTNWKSYGGKIKHAGLFLKPMYPVSDSINVYGLAGYAKTTTQGGLRRTDVNGLAFGAGFEYDLSDDVKKDAKYGRTFDGQANQEKGLGLFMDYERLYYKSGAPDLDALSAGITYDF